VEDEPPRPERADAARPEGVAVALLDAVGDRVEVVARAHAGEDERILREAGVDRLGQTLVRRAGALVAAGERGGLGARVHAGVGAACAQDVHGLAHDEAHGLFQLVLHRAEVGSGRRIRFRGFTPVGGGRRDHLALPTVERGSFVRDGEPVSRHSGHGRVVGPGGAGAP